MSPSPSSSSLPSNVSPARFSHSLFHQHYTTAKVAARTKETHNHDNTRLMTPCRIRQDEHMNVNEHKGEVNNSTIHTPHSIDPSPPSYTTLFPSNTSHSSPNHAHAHAHAHAHSHSHSHSLQPATTQQQQQQKTVKSHIKQIKTTMQRLTKEIERNNEEERGKLVVIQLMPINCHLSSPFSCLFIVCLFLVLFVFSLPRSSSTHLYSSLYSLTAIRAITTYIE
jgi:hypothetical protein